MGNSASQQPESQDLKTQENLKSPSKNGLKSPEANQSVKKLNKLQGKDLKDEVQQTVKKSYQCDDNAQIQQKVEKQSDETIQFTPQSVKQKLQQTPYINQKTGDEQNKDTEQQIQSESEECNIQEENTENDNIKQLENYNFPHEPIQMGQPYITAQETPSFTFQTKTLKNLPQLQNGLTDKNETLDKALPFLENVQPQLQQNQLTKSNPPKEQNLEQQQNYDKIMQDSAKNESLQDVQKLNNKNKQLENDKILENNQQLQPQIIVYSDKYKKIVKDIKKLEQQESNQENKTNLSKLYYQKSSLEYTEYKQPSKAIKSLDLCIQKDSKFAQAYKYRGYLKQTYQTDKSGALKDFKLAFKHKNSQSNKFTVEVQTNQFGRK